jgi:hypothetical protein
LSWTSGGGREHNAPEEIRMGPDHDSLEDASPLTEWSASIDKARRVGKVRIEYFADRDLNVPEGIELVLTTEQVTQMRESLQRLEADLRANPEQVSKGSK